MLEDRGHPRAARGRVGSGADRRLPGARLGARHHRRAAGCGPRLGQGGDPGRSGGREGLLAGSGRLTSRERGRWAVEEALRRLEQRQLVRRRHESSVAGDSEYVFEHALIRDVAYRTILRRLRAEKHRRAAEWLSSLPGDRRDRADAIAHHYVTALENAEAVGHARPSFGSRRRPRCRQRPSVPAHSIPMLLPLGCGSRRWSCALPTTTVARAGCSRTGRRSRSRTSPPTQVSTKPRSALLAAGDLSGAAEAESTSGWLLSLAGKPEQARARTSARSSSCATPLLPTPRRSSSPAQAPTPSRARPRDEALGLLEEALSIAEELGLREIEAEALQFIGMSRLDAGDEDGVHDIEKALAAAIELNSPVSLSCYGNLADMRRYFGSLERPRHSIWTASARPSASESRFRCGGFARSRRSICTTAVTGTRPWPMSRSTWMPSRPALRTAAREKRRIHRGRIRFARGDGDGALEDAQAALEFARETGEPFDLFPALAFHARASVEPAPDQAEASVDELLDALTAGQPFWGAWSLPDLLEGVGRGAPCRAAALLDAPRRARAGMTPLAPHRRRLRPRSRHLRGDRLAAGRGGRTPGGGQRSLAAGESARRR